MSSLKQTNKDTIMAASNAGLRIKGLTCDVAQTNFAWVGQDGVTEIRYSQEPGEHSRVPWFSVWKGDIMSAMVNGSHVSCIHYFSDD